MFNNNKYLKIRKLRDKFILKSNNGKIKIYSKLANILDKKLDRKYKYITIKLPSNYDIKHQIEDNPQFELLKDREIRCASRNKFYISDYDEKINRISSRINKHTIVKRFIDNTYLRSISYNSINMGAAILSHKVNGYIELSYLLSSLLVSFPINFYLKYENRYSKKHINNIDKYEILHNMEEVYQTLINNFCLLIYQLKIKNPLDMLFIYDSTIGKMCIEDNNITEEEYIDIVENIENNIDRGYDSFTTRTLGYSILLGYGVCRNHSVLFNDICARLGLESKICCIKENNRDDTYHNIVLVKYKELVFLLDPSNRVNYKIEGNNIISDEGNIKLDIIDDNIHKIIFKLIGFNTLNKNTKNVIYMDNTKELYNSLMDDVMLKRLERFNINNKLLINIFHTLYNELMTMDNKEKILTK